MDKLISWKQLEKKVARYYPVMEDALYEIESMRQFASLKLNRLLDETTIR
jgi:IS5 family transposase